MNVTPPQYDASRRWARRIRTCLLCWMVGWSCLPLSHMGGAQAQQRYEPVQRRLYLPEQQRLNVSDPPRLPVVPVPQEGLPETVAKPQDLAEMPLSLNDAIRIALQNARVVRVLAGNIAVSSGSTIYDPAIVNTNVNTQRSRFDPTFNVGDSLLFDESGQAIPGPRIAEINNDSNNLNIGGGKTTIGGGQASLNYNSLGSRSSLPLFLNPSHAEALELSYTQPWLRGAGVDVNLAPIVLARIDTEASYFRLKGSVQDLVRGVIEAYWNLVVARTDVWARKTQVEQGTVADQLARASLLVGRGNVAEVAQPRLALANFRNTLIASQADVLQKEAALRNILGLPPDVPISTHPHHAADERTH